jgi:hypothetical protein
MNSGPWLRAFLNLGIMDLLLRIRGVLPRTCLFLLVGCGDGGGERATSAPDTGQDGSGEAVCGDGRLSTTEACEGFELRSQRCSDLGFESGVLACASDCTFDTTRCVRCGDGVVGGSEVCDGTVDSTLTCASVRGDGATGALSCAADCTAILDDDCIDPAVDVPFAPCSESEPRCAEGLVCAPTELGDLCVPPCVGATDCPDDEWCSTVAPDVSTCLPRPQEGQECTGDIPCQRSQTCVPTFLDGSDVVSMCARTCEACESGESCVDVPSGSEELSSDTACVPDQAGACPPGFTCLDIGDGDDLLLRCVRPYAVCTVPQDLYSFGAQGPLDSQVCDLTGPTAGGRLCGLPATPGGATALCYPVFGDNESLGACIGLCDDGTLEGVADADCGDGWSCAAPAGGALYYPQPGPLVPCTAEDASACEAGYPECLDLGSGLTCVREARICIPDAEAP